MQFLRRSLVGLFLLAVTLGLLAWAGQIMATAIAARMAPPGPAEPARERVVAARVVLVTPGPVTPMLETYGQVRARRTLELRAPAGGRIVMLAPGFEDGAAVTAGQVLLRLDPAEAEAALAVAASDLRTEEAEGRDAARALVLARDELAAAQAQAALRAQAVQRQEDIKARGAGSDAAVETAALAASSADQAVLARRQALATAEARIDRSAAAVDRLRVALAEAARGLSDTTLTAGFDGTLSDVVVVAGGLVQANERLGALIDPDSLEVAFRLSTSQYARLIDAGGQLIPADVTVSLDAAGAEVSTTGRLVYAGLDAARGFRAGDFVAVRIAEPVLDNVAALPAAAVDAAAQVLVLDDGDRLQEAAVTVLRRQGDSVIVSTAGIAGREVVAERTPLLGAGIRVRPLRDGADAADAAMIVLTPAHRADLVARVQSDPALTAEGRARLLAELAKDRVPEAVIRQLDLQRGG